MKKLDSVSQIMTKSVVTVSEDDGLQEVVKLLKTHSIRHIPVVKGQEVSGIISRTDIDRLTFGSLFDNQDSSEDAILEMLSIGQVMTSKPHTVTPEMSIKDLAEIFTNEEYHALPVVKNGELVGIVTTTDVIRYLLEQYN
ncbi:CBS domain-containing protein [Solitalea lacus]|uniref:CBS domain-containing protein n=1 Tax=Solitalea lacus TaxID=2911172 RepID=UPI001EDA7F2A|nr:CBS domain-containing protein [Solitalea lacus]UKJ06325.1 CBS domain-containing protein [Solitalea lacus]